MTHYKYIKMINIINFKWNYNTKNKNINLLTQLTKVSINLKDVLLFILYHFIINYNIWDLIKNLVLYDVNSSYNLKFILFSYLFYNLKYFIQFICYLLIVYHSHTTLWMFYLTHCGYAKWILVLDIVWHIFTMQHILSILILVT